MKKEENSNSGVAAIILGIISVVISGIPFIGLIMGIVALSISIKAMKGSKKSLGAMGLTLSIIAIIIGFISCVIVFFLFFASENSFDDWTGNKATCLDGTPAGTCVFERTNNELDRGLYCIEKDSWRGDIVKNCTLCSCPPYSSCLQNGSCEEPLCKENCLFSSEKCTINYLGSKESIAQEMFTTCHMSYEQIKLLINSSISKKISLHVCEYGDEYCETVAGYALGDEIFLNPTIAETNPKNTMGVIIHEMTHVFQGNSERPFWITEGIADYVQKQLNSTGSYYLTYECYENQTYLSGYGCAAAFIEYLKPLCNGNLIFDLSINPYHEYNFENKCGASLEMLWENYPEKNKTKGNEYFDYCKKFPSNCAYNSS